MIVKITKRDNAKRIVDYDLNDEKQAKLIAAKGICTINHDTMAQSLNVNHLLHPELTKYVGHISLSFAVQDNDRMTDQYMADIAKEYLEKMGITNTPFMITRHFDHDYSHCHIAFSRIDNDGEVISDKFDFKRSVDVCRELTLAHGLYMAKGKEQVKEERLRESAKTKYQLYHILMRELERCRHWEQLIEALNKEGITVEFKTKGNTDEVQGVIFTKGKYRFNGSKIDRSLSFSKITARLRANLYAYNRHRFNYQQESHRATIRLPTGNVLRIPNAAMHASVNHNPADNRNGKQWEDMTEMEKQAVSKGYSI